MDPSTLSPVCIFLAKKGGGGDRVLFRYPYSAPTVKRNAPEIRNTSINGKQAAAGNNNGAKLKRNPYALSHHMLMEDPFNQNRFDVL